MQMRGSLSQRVFEDKITPHCSLDDLALSPHMKDQADTIVRFEKARSTVYGSWASKSSSSSSTSR